MVAVTFGSARVAGPAVADESAGAETKGFFMRMFEAFTAAQMLRAKREIARHRHLLPPGFKPGYSEDEPFGGW